MPEWIGRTLSKVEIQARLGRGMMAEVYLGHHTTLQRPVAVKILHSPLAEDPVARERFRAEAQVVATLRHPNLTQVYDFDLADGQPYMVMELVTGATLETYLQAGHRLPPETVLRLVLPIAAALDYAHARGVVHRDVKPANILLRAETAAALQTTALPQNVEVVLSDFGVARFSHLATLSGTGTISGTPTYLSPEQAQGLPVDGRADIYALGVVVYEMLAGHPPFGGPDETLFSLVVKHITTPPPPLPEASPALQQVLTKVLAKSPADRYAHAGEFAAALLNAVWGLTLPAPTAPAQSLESVLTALHRLVEQAQAYDRALPPDNYPARAAVGALHELAQAALAEARDLADAKPALPGPPAQHPFSPRELEVLTLTARGLTNKEIAYRLRLSERTVQFHLNSVFNKTATNSRTEAVAVALRQNWLPKI